MIASNKGFTLIECLVALFIIAIVLASATKAMGTSINTVRESYIREVANWVASNQSEEAYLNHSFPAAGKTTKAIQMAGIEFIVTSEVKPTANPYFKQITTSVAQKAKPDYIIFKNVGFISLY